MICSQLERQIHPQHAKHRKASSSAGREEKLERGEILCAGLTTGSSSGLFATKTQQQGPHRDGDTALSTPPPLPPTPNLSLLLKQSQSLSLSVSLSLSLKLADALQANVFLM